MKYTHKLRLFLAIGCISAALGMSACTKVHKTAGFKKDKTIEDTQVTENHLTLATEAETDKKPLAEPIEDIDWAYEEILEHSTKEFIGHHLIDDAFLAWVSSEYGNACVVEIAEELKSGNTDKNLWYDKTKKSIHVLWLLYCQATGFQDYQLENVTWQECASEDEITLAFTGDVNFAEDYVTTKHMDASKNGIYDCFSKDLLEIMNGVDVMMVNNEFTYSRRGTPLAGKAYTFRANPSRVDLLDVLGTDIVNIANNHVYDFGPDALIDTIDTLDQAGIPHVGAGENLEEACKPYYFVCNGRKIAIVAATQIERTLDYTKEATENTPGVLKTLEPDKFVEVIEKAEKNSDYVIAVVHWGTEGDSNYGRDQYNLARAFADAGADAIIGGHTHCLQGFEIMDEVPIIYSLGNFWFSSSLQDTGLAKVTIDKDGGLTLSFIPCVQKDTRTYLVTEEQEKQRIWNFMQEHSAQGVEVTRDGIVQENES